MLVLIFFFQELKSFLSWYKNNCLSAALNVHGNILPGRKRPLELSYRPRTWRTATMWNSCDDSIHVFRSHWVNLIPSLQLDKRDCGETAGKVITLMSAWKIIRVYAGTRQFSAFWICNSCEDLVSNLSFEIFARNIPTKEFLSLQCLTALWQVMFPPFFLSIPEQPQAGDSAVCKMRTFFRQPEFFAGSSEYPGPCQGHTVHCWYFSNHFSAGFWLIGACSPEKGEIAIAKQSSLT